VNPDNHFGLTGVVRQIWRQNSKFGNPYFLVKIEDNTGDEVTVCLKKVSFEKYDKVKITGRLSSWGNHPELKAKKVEVLERASPRRDKESLCGQGAEGACQG
jgi:hypothetical protein